MILDLFLLKFSSSSKVCLLWIPHSYFCAIFYSRLRIFINKSTFYTHRFLPVLFNWRIKKKLKDLK